VACGGRSAIFFQDRCFQVVLTYSSHALACRAALATIAVYEEDDLYQPRQAGAQQVDGGVCPAWRKRTPSVGAARCIGCSVSLNLVRDRQDHAEPRRPFNGTSPEMAALVQSSSVTEGLFTLVRWNYFFTQPHRSSSPRSSSATHSASSIAGLESYRQGG
jgi:adenosylmethionine-8-amino-7-oxononanoate aminotransferase